MEIILYMYLFQYCLYLGEFFLNYLKLHSKFT